MPLPLPLPLQRGNLGVIAAYAIELVCCACAHTIIASSAHNDRQCGKGGICFGFFADRGRRTNFNSIYQEAERIGGGGVSSRITIKSIMAWAPENERTKEVSSISD